MHPLLVKILSQMSQAKGIAWEVLEQRSAHQLDVRQGFLCRINPNPRFHEMDRGFETGLKIVQFLSAGFAGLISCRKPVIAWEREHNRTCAPCLLEEKLDWMRQATHTRSS